MAKLRLRLYLGDKENSRHGSVVRIAVRDTSLADALHPTVAEATEVVEPGAVDVEVTVDVPETLDARNRYSIWAHVDHDGSGSIHPGDLITVQDVTVGPADLEGEPIDVPLAQI